MGETGVHGGNPCKHGESIQTPCRCCPWWVLNPGPQHCKATVLTTEPPCHPHICIQLWNNGTIPGPHIITVRWLNITLIIIMLLNKKHHKNTITLPLYKAKIILTNDDHCQYIVIELYYHTVTEWNHFTQINITTIQWSYNGKYWLYTSTLQVVYVNTI